MALFVVLVVVGALADDPDDGNVESDDESAAVTSEEAGSTDTAPEDEPRETRPRPTTAPTTTAAPTTTEAPTTTAPPQPVTYSGSGTTVLTIENPFVDEGSVMHITHVGGSNFVVWTLDDNLDQDELAVNTIGSYDGILPLDLLVGQRSTALEIDADGSWTVEIRPMTSIRRFDASIDGVGDDVVLYEGDTSVAEMANQGSSNFVVWSYGADSDLLVNEIGPWSGAVPLRNPGVLVITAEGPWSIATQ